MKQSELLKKWKKELGEKLNTRVIGTGKQAFSIKTFENGFFLKRANRGEIVLDRFDLMMLSDISRAFEKKKRILKELE